MSRRQNIIIAVVVLCALAFGWWFFNNKNGSVNFRITNTADFNRINELVEVTFPAIGIKSMDNLVLTDSLGTEIPYQTTDNSLLFQASLEGNSSMLYHLRQGTPAAPRYKVFARFVPERKDDFAWENDIAAYRMYGPALAPENPSNGVDLWLKKTEELIVDTFYYREHELGLPYHVDYGKGLDCYKVGHTVGCGGVALLYNDSLYVGNHYDEWEIIEAGPLRTIFELRYDSVLLDSIVLSETLRVTVSAGAVLNKAEVTYSGADVADLCLAAGIFLHDDSLGVIKTGMPGNHWIAYAEDARSDAGLDVGRNYVGVAMPDGEAAEIKGANYVIYQPYEVGDVATYYFGGGWSQWLYPTDEIWFEAVDRFDKMRKNPLKVTLIK